MSLTVARTVCETLRCAGYSAYVVGGFVRDRLLGRATGDVDVASDARPEQVTAIFDRVHATGLAHGTVTIMVGDEPVEHTTFRREGVYRDGRRPQVVQFVGSIEEDLARRDFTVNAVAWDPLSDTLVDPFGGEADGRAGLLRCVGNAEERFEEDALRLLRAIRFHATHGLEPAPGMEQAMAATAAGLERIAAERIEREITLIFERAERPSEAFNMARRCGLLPHVMPELLPLIGQAQNRHHAYDCWDHTMACVDAVPPGDAARRWAALLHDLGKPGTAELHPERPGEYRFYGHERLSLDLSAAIAERLRFSKNRRERVDVMVGTHMMHPTAEWGDAALRRLLSRLGDHGLEDFLALKRADIIAKGTPDVPEILAAMASIEERLRELLARGSAISRRDLALDGRQLAEALGRPPGKWLGPTLAALLDTVIEDPSLNRPERLVARARQLSDG